MKQRYVALVFSALLFAILPAAQAGTLFEDSFDSDLSNFAPFLAEGVWRSHYDEDAWRSDLNGGVCSKRDDGCNCIGGQGSCSFTVYTNGNGSDPYDNHITHSPDVPWTDYEFSVRFRNADNDTIGVLFRYVNTANFYVVLMTRDRFPGANGCDQFYPPTTQVVRVVDGNRQVLAETDQTYTVDAEHQLNIVAIGPAMQVFLDGELLLEADDDSDAPLLEGGIGLLMIQNGADENACAGGGCWFDDVLVTEVNDVSDLDDDGLADEDDNCPKVKNPEQLDYDQDGLGDVCDGDDDNDGVPDTLDNCPLLADASPADFDGDGKGDDCDDDDDNDGLPDALESGGQEDQDPDSKTDPNNPDTDGDGIPDGEEDANQNGKVDEGETDPLIPDNEPPPPADEDGNPPGTEEDTLSSDDATEGDSSVTEDTGPSEDIGPGGEDTKTDNDVAKVEDDISSGDSSAPAIADKPATETIVFGGKEEGCNATGSSTAFPLVPWALAAAFLALMRRRLFA